VREREGGRAAIRSSSIRVQEGDGQRRAKRRQPTGRAYGGSSGRWKTVGLTDRVGPPASEGRRRADWAEKGGRRWAAAGLEKEGGGRAETVAQAEIQKSKKKNQF
jgi:hypothetical protein